MVRHTAAAALLLAALPASACTQQGPRAERVVLPDVSIIDGTGAAPLRHRQLVLHGGRIEAVRPADAPVPAGAQVLERYRGHTVMPGLIDAHVHLATSPRDSTVMRALGRAALLGGVTTVRDMGGNTARLAAAHAQWGPDSAPAPRLLSSAVIAGAASNWFRGERSAFMQSAYPDFGTAASRVDAAHTPEVARAATRNIAVTDTASLVRAILALRGTGIAGVKLLEALSPLEIAVATRTARRAGLRVWSHLAITPVDPLTIVRAAPHTVSHADMAAWALVERSRVQGADSVVARQRARREAFEHARFTDPRVVALLDSMRARDVALDPTLTVFAQAVHAERQRPDPAAPMSYAHLMRFSAGFVRAAHARGVRVIAGTDALGGSSPNLHLELQLLVDSAGFTPLAAIRAATGDAAYALGLADSLGTIAAGKVADLVIVDGAPEQDIAATLRVRAVMRAGRLWERERPLAPPALARAAPPETPTPDRGTPATHR